MGTLTFSVLGYFSWPTHEVPSMQNSVSKDKKINAVLTQEKRTKKSPAVKMRALAAETDAAAYVRSWVKRLSASRTAERKRWMSRWPQPQNEEQRMMLMVFSLTDLPDADIGDFDRVLEQTGAIIDEFSVNPVNRYLGAIVYQAVEEADAPLRASIFKYNSKHGVDDYLTQNLRYDIKMIIEGKVNVSPTVLEDYFVALAGSQDIDERERFVQATSLIDRASDDSKYEMAKEISSIFSDLLEPDLETDSL